MCAPQVPPSPETRYGVGERRRVSEEDVKQVHILLEACIQRSMTKEQAVAALSRLGVKPRFSFLVWDRLEAENPEFFEGYNNKLKALAEIQELQLAA